MDDYDKILEFTAVTSGGRALDISFPLHEHTRSSEGVASLVTALLDSVSTQTAGGKPVSDGDILQALAMTLAIRARIVDENSDTIRKLLHELVDVAVDATRHARVYQAARA